MTGTGQANFAGLVVGNNTGASGFLNLSGTALVHANLLAIGTSKAGAPGGIAIATIAGAATLASDRTVSVGYGSAVVLAGGTLSSGDEGNGVQINPGATVSGYGTVSSAVHGVTDNGALAASGGTLTVAGNLSGIGTVQIAAGATLNLVSSRIDVPSLAFLGSNAALDLTAGVGGNFAITGFGVGDQIVMAGIDQASWSGASHVLTLSEHGQVMDKLHLPDIATEAAFQISHGTISLVSVMTNAVHH